MQNLPPHLPKKIENKNSSTLRRTLFYFISFTLISIAASLATVFAAISWIVPRAVPEVRFYTFEHQETKKETETIDTVVLDRISQKEVKLYDKTKMLDKKWYSSGSMLSTGVFLTSDGWAVFPFESTASVDKKNLEVVDSRGLSYIPEKIFFDTNLQLMYAKVTGEGFHFVNFVSKDVAFQGNSFLLRKNNGYEQMKLETIQKNSRFEKADALWKPLFVYMLDAELSSPVFSLQGDLSGFVSSEKTFIPAWYVDQALVSLLSKQDLSIKAFPWKGEFIENVFSGAALKSGIGFYVTDVPDKNKDILVHDVIVKVAGNEFSALTFSQMIFESSDTVEFQILRDGKLLDKKINKQIISLD